MEAWVEGIVEGGGSASFRSRYVAVIGSGGNGDGEGGDGRAVEAIVGGIDIVKMGVFVEVEVLEEV